jgi:hypothetical protein
MPGMLHGQPMPGMLPPAGMGMGQSEDTAQFKPPPQKSEAEQLLAIMGGEGGGAATSHPKTPTAEDLVSILAGVAAPAEPVATAEPINIVEFFNAPRFLQGLNVRNEAAIHALYGAFPFQCKATGKRMRTQEEYSKHLDRLYKKNKLREDVKSGKVIMHRQWYVSEEEWVKMDINADPEEKEAAAPTLDQATGATDGPRLNKALYNGKVVADEKYKRCPISNEDFEEEWDDELNEWVYKDAVQPKGPGTPIYNIDCYSREKADALENGGPKASAKRKRDEDDDDGSNKRIR